MYTRSKCLFVFLTAALAATSAFGQDAPRPCRGSGSRSPTMVRRAHRFQRCDRRLLYFNSNHPASGKNGLYNFDTKANQFSLSMAKLSMSHSADPIGFQVDFGFGKTFDIVNGGEPALGTKNIEQAFVSWKPKGKDSGFQMDFGKFVTSAGAEVIESLSQLELLSFHSVCLGDSLLPLRLPRHGNQGPLHGRLPAGQWVE